MKRIIILIAGLVALLALTGCHTPDDPTPHVAVATAKAEGAFMETAKVNGRQITLAIEPVKVGPNRLIVTLDDKQAKAVEAALIMSAMGHGTVVDLAQAAPGRWEISTDALGMDGRWMVRVRTTPADGGPPSDAIFWLDVKQ